MNKSIEPFTKLAHKGDAQAQYELGIILIADADTYWQGMEWLEKSAEQGHEDAQNTYDDEIIDDDGRFDAWV